jgi:hypothetical protein
MMKAISRDKEGHKRYLFGLSALNIYRLLSRDPIAFDGRELKLPGHAFLIAVVDSRDQAERLFAAHKKTVGAAKLHAIGLLEPAVRLLQTRPIEIEQLGGLDGRVSLLYAETEQQFAQAMGFADVQPVKSGYRDVLDPTTGVLVRRPERLDS